MPAPVRSQQEEEQGKPEELPPGTTVCLPQQRERTARSAASATNLDAAGAGGGGARPKSGDPRASARRIRLGAVAGSRARCGKRRWLAFRHRGDRGAGAVEVVIAVPLLMLIILVIVQFAVVWYAHAVAQATAEEALAAARVQGGSAAAGEQRAAQVLGQIGGAVLVGPQVSVTRSAVTATVQVQAAADRRLCAAQ